MMSRVLPVPELAKVVSVARAPSAPLAPVGKPFLSAVFPAYNEEESIEAVIREAETALGGAGFTYEIIVCDDGSSDRTRAIVQGLAEAMPALRLIKHEKNQGIQATLEDLYANARGQWVFHNGSDGQWRTAEVLRMLRVAAPRTIVIGRRKNKHYGWKRSVVSSLFNWLPFLLFGVKTYDAGSIKLVPRAIFADIKPVSQGVFREAERLIRAARRGYRILPLDVDCRPRRTGLATGCRNALILEAARELLLSWWCLMICRDQ